MAAGIGAAPSGRIELPYIPAAIRPVLLLLPLILAGCLDDQRQAASRCTMDARRLYPQMAFAGPFDQPGAYIIDCMGAAGYGFTMALKECPVSDWAAANPYCYRPRGRIAGWIFRAELAAERQGL